MKLARRTSVAVLIFSISLPSPVVAGSGDVVVENAWSRASVGTSRPSAAYMTIQNTGDELIALTEIRTGLARTSEIHRTSTNDQGVSSMAPAGAIEIAPGQTVELEPGGLHAMLMQLQLPMTEGDSFPLTLLFSDGGEVRIEVPVLGIAARGPAD